MSDSDSPLSTPPPSDEEEKPSKILKAVNGKLTFLPVRKAPSSKTAPKKKPMVRLRAPSSSPEVESDGEGQEKSQPHEYVLADNQDIAFITMFRNRFSDVFPKNVSNIGPQDVERGVVDTQPSEQMENLLCALISLALNRIKPVERGHHGRALEEVISQNKKQWPRSWKGVNPLHGNQSFHTMNPTERLVLLRTLTHWSLAGSEAVNAIIKDAYRQTRKNDDINQPLSVQPWGVDGRKRRYWLIEGHNDTPFRIYLESSRKRRKNTWWSVAGTIDEAKELSEQLSKDKAQSAQRLASGILSAVPRLEETERKRQRKQYRQDRRAAFSRPEPGASLYEGRTRGNRVRYNYDDDDFDIYGSEDAGGTRRSARQSGTPADDGAGTNGPSFTASGRQVRSRFGRTYGGESAYTSSKGTSPVRDFDSVDGDEGDDEDAGPVVAGRGGARRSERSRPVNGRDVDGDEDMDDDDDDDEASENAWGGDDDDVTGRHDVDEADDDMSDADEADSLLDEAHAGSDANSSMVVKLKYGRSSADRSSPLAPPGVGDAENRSGESKPKEEEEAQDVSMVDSDSLNFANGTTEVSQVKQQAERQDGDVLVPSTLQHEQQQQQQQQQQPQQLQQDKLQLSHADKIREFKYEPSREISSAAGAVTAGIAAAVADAPVADFSNDASTTVASTVPPPTTTTTTNGWH